MKIKDKTYLINLDYKSKVTHWVVTFVQTDLVTYFESFGVEYLP